MLPMTDAGKLIDDGPARIVAVVVHAAQIHQEVKAQGRLGMLAHLGDALGVGHGHGDFAPELEGLEIRSPNFSRSWPASSREVGTGRT